MNFEAAEQWLNQSVMFGIKLGLGNMFKLLELLNHPEKRCQFIHLAGTNGKGSTGALIHAALFANDFKTGFYSSPHLSTIRERFRINGELVSETEFAAACTVLQSAIDQWNQTQAEADQLTPTFFELTTALAAYLFAENGVDYVIWETGMGGRLDATSTVTPICSIITNIGFDHTQYLGDTREEIAAEKAGIIKPHIPVFCGEPHPEARHVIREVAAENQAPFFEVNHDFQLQSCRFEAPYQLNEVKLFGTSHTIKTRLTGTHQGLNATLAAAVLTQLAPQLNRSVDALLHSMEKALWPGRLQALETVNGPVWIDGCHNSHAAEQLSASLNTLFQNQKWHFVMGILAEKDPLALIKHLRPHMASLTLLGVNNPRSFDPQATAPLIRQAYSDLPIDVIELAQLPQAIQAHKTLITGSLYLIGDILQTLTPNQHFPIIHH